MKGNKEYIKELECSPTSMRHAIEQSIAKWEMLAKNGEDNHWFKALENDGKIKTYCALCEYTRDICYDCPLGEYRLEYFDEDECISNSICHPNWELWCNEQDINLRKSLAKGILSDLKKSLKFEIGDEDE